MGDSGKKRAVVAVTGASGIIYARVTGVAIFMLVVTTVRPENAST